MALRYHLVDEVWTHLGWFDSEIPDWSVGHEFVDPLGRPFAITGISRTPTQTRTTPTWTVEPA